MKTRAAQLQDVTTLVGFINEAYRQPHSKSWTSEIHLFDGDRIDDIQLLNVLGNPAHQCIVHEDESGIVACICVHDHDKIAYISIFAVRPDLQGQGIGKSVLAMAEEYIYYFNEKVKYIHIPVYAVQEELIKFYERQGYRQIPLQHDESREIPQVLGEAKQLLTLLLMEKELSR